MRSSNITQLAFFHQLTHLNHIHHFGKMFLHHLEIYLLKTNIYIQVVL